MQTTNHRVLQITEPDVFYSADISILSVDGDLYNDHICNYLCNIQATLVVFLADSQSDVDWLMNCYNQSTVTLVNMEKPSFNHGLLLHKPRVYFYNSHKDYSRLNLNYIDDPLDFLIKLLDSDHTVKYNSNTK